MLQTYSETLARNADICWARRDCPSSGGRSRPSGRSGSSVTVLLEEVHHCVRSVGFDRIHKAASFSPGYRLESASEGGVAFDELRPRHTDAAHAHRQRQRIGQQPVRSRCAYEMFLPEDFHRNHTHPFSAGDRQGEMLERGSANRRDLH